MTIEQFWSEVKPKIECLTEADPISTIAGDISDTLRQIHPAIGVEIRIDSVKELILTAYGDAQYFNLIKDIVSRAPHINGWRIVPLKEGKGFKFSIRLGDQVFAVSDLKAKTEISKNDRHELSILIFARRELAPLLNWEELVAIILSTGLGEENYAKIKSITIRSFDEAPQDAFHLDFLEAIFK